MDPRSAPLLPLSPSQDGPAIAARAATAGWIGALSRTACIDADPTRIFPRVIDELAVIHGAAPALIGLHETLSHRDLAARQNRYARWALAEGLQTHGLIKGDTVALLMRNQPDFLAIWLGLTRVGVCVALLNTNLSGQCLAHCLDVANPRLVIAGTDLAEVLGEALRHSRVYPAIRWQGVGAESSLAAAAAGYDAGPLDPTQAPSPSLRDPALLIYTSGTTGLPKAARVSHHRIMMWTHWFAGLIAPTPRDRMYDCLPLYHSVGGIVATGSVLLGGGAVVIREKFSARLFWTDVIASGATLFQYIGELCRYLTVAPPDPGERSHALRLCIGNGLRPEVWERFQDRFVIPRILEFYAATEGTLSLYNVEGRIGAVGRVPPFMARRSPALIVRHNSTTGLPLRDTGGRCVPADEGEVGELLGRLSDKAEHSFEGYTSPEESERKILRDVVEPGDAWMRTGDLMRRDGQGFFYFLDRIGDTFRWKGENVATTEVAEAIARVPGVREVSVYGVAVPGTEGRAGMATLDLDQNFDLELLHRRLRSDLPAYARPVFLRIAAEIGHTETFKQKKNILAEQGFDPAGIADPLYLDTEEGYVRIDAGLFRAIVSGETRL